MADNIRPALYSARYEAAIANRKAAGPDREQAIVGKYCESGDILIERAMMPEIATGDLLALPATGAYCLAMASNYNLAIRPAVVLIKKGQVRLIRRRETYEDLLRLEVPGD
jgi:diaminopimelate decarboxylase